MRLLCLAQFMMPPDPTQAPRAKQVYEIWKQKIYGRVTRGDGATPPERVNAEVAADVDAGVQSQEPEVLFDVDSFFAEEVVEVDYDWGGVWVDVDNQ